MARQQRTNAELRLRVKELNQEGQVLRKVRRRRRRVQIRGRVEGYVRLEEE